MSDRRALPFRMAGRHCAVVVHPGDVSLSLLLTIGPYAGPSIDLTIRLTPDEARLIAANLWSGADKAEAELATGLGESEAAA
ncbi:MAG: hypothetical protein U1E23_09390 [Reyranellaceae bacterium]